jgi:DNA-binding GntR family transcriptional regulator
VAKRGDGPDAVYTVLRRAILEQALGPGRKLPEDTIGERLGVSRTVVRRALERLAADELVELAPNRGAAVARPSLDEAHDVFAVRMDLERLVLERVCGNLTRAQIKVLEKAIAQEARAHRRRSPDYIRHAAKFHLQLATMAGSPLLFKYIRALVARSALILGLYGRPDWPNCSMDEHRAVLAALVAGDLKRARKLMHAHLDEVLSRALDAPVATRAPSVGDVLAAYAAELVPARELQVGGR